MHEWWYLFIFIWAAVELYGYFRKKPFRERMKSGAISAVVIMSLSTAGQLNVDQNIFVRLCACFILFGIVAIVIFYARVVLAKLFSR